MDTLFAIVWMIIGNVWLLVSLDAEDFRVELLSLAAMVSSFAVALGYLAG